MKEQLAQIKKRAMDELGACQTVKELEDLRVKVLGKKGELTGILKQMGRLSAEERPVIGQMANEVRQDLERKIEEIKAALKEKQMAEQLASEQLDVTMPGRPFELGSMHPLSLVLEEIEEIFLGMGFDIAEGPEVEYDYYNFEALNLPKFVIPVTTVTVGYPAEIPAQVDRLPAEALIHDEQYKDYTSEDIDRIYAEKESLPESKKYITENNKETLAQVFTDVRYPKANNEHFSDIFLKIIREQGFQF